MYTCIYVILYTYIQLCINMHSMYIYLIRHTLAYANTVYFSINLVIKNVNPTPNNIKYPIARSINSCLILNASSLFGILIQTIPMVINKTAPQIAKNMLNKVSLFKNHNN